jgi:hypothetical protein
VLSILAWWAIPIGAVIVAAAMSGLARRVRRQTDDDTIAAYRRFRDALAKDDASAGFRPSSR